MKVTKFGTKHVGIIIGGDPNNPEPENVSIRFPGGEVTVTRATDGGRPDYWVHVTAANPDWTNRPDGETGTFSDSRCDFTDKHAGEVESEVLADPALYHVALRVRREER